jgi:hypothetical protein
MSENGALRDTRDLSEGEFYALFEIAKLWQFITYANGGHCLKSELEAWLTKYFGLSAAAGRVITNRLTVTFDPRTLHGVFLELIAGLAENQQLIEEIERLKAENTGLRRKHNDYEHPDDTIARGREMDHLKIEIFNLRGQLDMERRIVESVKQDCQRYLSRIYDLTRLCDEISAKEKAERIEIDRLRNELEAIAEWQPDHQHTPQLVAKYALRGVTTIRDKPATPRPEPNEPVAGPD